jgi:Bifunctional DNA primase/polymerase, N-terminal
VHRWWTDRPDALIGVPTGVKFDVLDVDNGRHADAEKWLQENQHRLPLTRTHITRSGGRHFLFAPTPGLRCSSSRLGPHVDIRAEGGYVIMWPVCGLEVLHGGTLATLPDWIPATLQPPPVPTIELAPRWQAMSPDRARRQLDGIIRVVAWASEGERNAKTFWGACRLAEMTREGFLSRNDAIAVAVEAASRAGLPRQEALRTAQSAFRKIIGA